MCEFVNSFAFMFGLIVVCIPHHTNQCTCYVSRCRTIHIHRDICDYEKTVKLEVKGSNHELFKTEGENGTVVLKKFTFRKDAELTGLCKSIYAVQKLQDRGVKSIIRITGIVHGEPGEVYLRMCIVCMFVYEFTHACAYESVGRLVIMYTSHSFQ